MVLIALEQECDHHCLTILSEYDLTDIPMTNFDYLSLLLGTDPLPYLQGTD